MQHASSTPAAALQKCQAAVVALALPSAAQSVASQLENAAGENCAACLTRLEKTPSFEASSNRGARQFVPGLICFF